jgi:hypothetical protein
MDNDRPKGKLELAEQRFSDPTLGAEVLLKVVAGSSEPFRLQIRFFGSDEVREIRFDADGLKSGSGTKIADAPEPSSRLRLMK